MASSLPPTIGPPSGPSPAGGSPMDSPPPQFSPSPTGMPPGGPPPVSGPNPENTPVDPKKFGDGIVKTGSELDQTLTTLGQIIGKKSPDSVQYIVQAQKNLKTALSKFLSDLGWSPSSSPTATGDFQGGGFGSNPPPPTPPSLG